MSKTRGPTRPHQHEANARFDLDRQFLPQRSWSLHARSVAFVRTRAQRVPWHAVIGTPTRQRQLKRLPMGCVSEEFSRPVTRRWLREASSCAPSYCADGKCLNCTDTFFGLWKPCWGKAQDCHKIFPAHLFSGQDITSLRSGDHHLCSPRQGEERPVSPNDAQPKPGIRRPHSAYTPRPQISCIRRGVWDFGPGMRCRRWERKSSPVAEMPRGKLPAAVFGGQSMYSDPARIIL